MKPAKIRIFSDSDGMWLEFKRQNSSLTVPLYPQDLKPLRDALEEFVRQRFGCDLNSL